VAGGLLDISRTEDTVSRFGGDEFVILVEELDDQEQALFIAEKILKTFDSNYYIQGYKLNMSTSIGIALFPDHGKDTEQLIKQADVAMYEAKNSGRNQYKMFAREYLDSAVAGLTLEYEIRQGLENDEFFLEYQPQYNLDDHSIAGFEGLIRWEHPQHGRIPPAEFIPVAESSGMIEKIGLWVFKQVCNKVVEWSEKGLPFNRIGFNLSQRQLMDSDMANKFIRELNETGAIDYAGCIECEITESLIITHVEIALNSLNKLKETGLKLAIDDFGTGHSSLVNLKRFPLDRLKIDREFVNDIGMDQNDEAIIKASVALAQGFDLEVVAEGVETETQLQFLKLVGCHEVQGFYFSKPVSASDAELLLDEQIKIPKEA